MVIQGPENQLDMLTVVGALHCPVILKERSLSKLLAEFTSIVGR